MDPVTAE